jgi:hypothetical protein
MLFPDPFRIWIRIHRIHMFLGLSGFGSFYHQAKIATKTLIPTILWLLLDFLSLKNDVNGVPYLQNVKSRKTVLKKLFLLASWRSAMKIAGSGSESGSTIQRHGSTDPDPHKNFMDPEHKYLGILTKIIPSITTYIVFIFFYLIYFEIRYRYLTAIIFNETRITIWATHTKNTDPGIPSADIQLSPPSSSSSCQCST